MPHRLTAAAMLAWVCAAPAAAQTRFDPFARADGDRDGVVTRTEFVAARDARFARLDRNKDGVLTTADTSRIARFRPSAGEMIEQFIVSADQNGDGRLSRAELASAPTPVFDHADANGDGAVDKAEAAALRGEIVDTMDGLFRSPAFGATALAFILLELVWRLRSGRGYDAATALTTLGVMAGQLPFAALGSLVQAGIFTWVFQHSLFRLPLDQWQTWAAGFFAIEFAYYWLHRASHRVRWLWATHAVHHSATELTFLASARLGWTNLLSGGWLAFLPLIWVGLDPRLVVGLLILNLRYQFFLHTEAIGRLGPLEWVFNTPTHHRFHHASNDAYLDRNYGGVLIIFDRLFGTLAQDTGEPLRYGLRVGPILENPIVLAFREWRLMIADARKERSWKGVAVSLFGHP